MKTKKIVAKEVPPENIDFRFYFDNDCFSRRCGDIDYEIIRLPLSRRAALSLQNLACRYRLFFYLPQNLTALSGM